METRLLKYFLAIAKAGTISKASRELHVTQPTLSRQLKTLEEELGTELFIRKQRQMILTRAGVQYQRDAHKIISMLDNAKKKAQQVENNVVGTITIGCIEANAAELIAKSIKLYHQKYPAVKFELYDLDSTDIQERLDQGLLDLGVVLKPSETAKYYVQNLNLTDQWGIVVSKNILPDEQTISQQELQKLPIFITRNSIMQSEMSSLLKIPLEKLQIVGTQNLVSNSLYLAENQTAYPLCASGAFVGNTSKLKFLPLQDTDSIKQQLIWSKQRKTSDVVDDFIDLLVDQDNQYLMKEKL
ncbi:LysR family transcriptional regulator [Companilactobacillus alimentarius]|uniref:HTH lysR-type domain-containing protein n=1 Tax=Companilactobacillus alimentarius DSM 20249 TaxID=1423720 RepID=A0A2K9HPC4_9LACO|nr:LysR family transcriptional regulator [Companilactobacillus alimentarius]AUI71182.1 hypothetical protein LA20249_02750 [Companilactobacillus alimentarius DSM 20249]KRK75312.1 lysr family transcriptional regulator [Companilactobacillus alimentarius DSM 20249]MDT6951547.1 LysR family transcriptional regulator [Companilactobacillus alimentarius]GEO43905.1 LysR family transcriptional regulator [Companilactobacillus alimentarius]